MLMHITAHYNVLKMTVYYSTFLFAEYIFIQVITGNIET